MKILIDQLGTIYNFEKPPSRIISLVPSQTELLFDLGLEENIIGITKFCFHPKHFLKEKVKIGGTKNVNFEKIKSLNPDIIIANKEENTQKIVEELSKICPVWVTNIITIQDNLKMIYDFGELFEKQVIAQNWINKIEIGLTNFKIFIKNQPIQKVAYFIWAKPYMVAGNNNFINEMLKLNKFENVFQNQERYPEIEIEKMQSETNVELILLSSEPFPFKENHKVEIQQFVKEAKIILVDGELFSWYGSRIIKAFDYFKVLNSKIN